MPRVVLFSSALLAVSSPAFAGVAPIPAPLAGGAFGPVGLVVAAVGYAAYRVIKARSDR